MSMEEAKRLAAEIGLDEPDDGAFLAQEYGMNGQPAVQVRNLEIIEGEIHFYKRQAGASIIEIGKRLNEAKAQLGHGEWLPWLQEKVGFSERSARDFMRLAREYSKSAEIADLGAAKALALLALPASERNEFTSEKHTVNGVEKTVSDMTAKELKQAIRERDEARQEAEAARADLSAAEEACTKMEADVRMLKELNQRAAEAEKEKSEELRLLEAELEELRSKPVEVAIETRDAAPEQLEEARRQARAAADELHKVDISAKEDQIRQLKEDLKKAKAEAKSAEDHLKKAEAETRAAKDAAEKAKRAAEIKGSQNMAKFSVLFDSAKNTANEMAEVIKRESAENQVKMRNAMCALADAIRKAAGI